MPPTTSAAVLRPRRLVLAALLGATLVLSSLSGATPASAATPSPGQMAMYLFSTINALRKAHGQPALALDSRLNAAATAHARLMQRHGGLSHQFAGEPTVAQRIAQAGYRAASSAELVGIVRTASDLTPWQKRIMMYPIVSATVYSTRYKNVGIGLISDPTHRSIWIVEDFAQPAAVPLNVQYANSVLSLMNQERAANGRPALRMNSLLIRSAHAHNLTMARYNTMSHQLPNEPFFANRILAAGYNYSTAGENIGWNSDRSLSGVIGLQKVMYNEVPPDDGHRLNILSGSYRDVGIDVYFDTAHGKVWLTEDFGSLL